MVMTPCSWCGKLVRRWRAPYVIYGPKRMHFLCWLNAKLPERW